MNTIVMIYRGTLDNDSEFPPEQKGQSYLITHINADGEDVLEHETSLGRAINKAITHGIDLDASVQLDKESMA